MLRKLTALAVTLVVALQSVSAFNVVVPAGERRCFFENLEKGDSLHVSYQVGEGGHLDIDFWVNWICHLALSMQESVQQCQRSNSPNQRTR